MRKIYIGLFVLLSLNSSAQLAVKLLQFRPVGDFGMTFKKAFTGEIMYREAFDDWEPLKYRFGLSYINFKPRLDTFPTYGIKEDGNGTTVLPGYQVYHHFSMLFFFGGMDYAFILKDKYYVYGGGDLIIGGIDQTYDHATETLISESFSGGSKMGGGRLRLGGEYMFNDHIGAFLEITRAWYYTEDNGWLSNNDIGIGAHYIFN